MILIDVHAHLDFEDFDKDREKLIENCQKEGVKIIINNGVDEKTNRITKELSEKYEIIKPAYGYYPTHIEEKGYETAKKEIEWIKTQNPIALGEIGMDYKEGKNKELQEKIFRKFIKLGKKKDIPLIIHSRKAEHDVLEILEEEKASKVVLHCFMGKKKLILKAKELGYNFSIPVIATKLEQLQWMIKEVPISQLLTETDAPYLSPIMGERNDPRNVNLTIKKIAEIKEMNEEEVANNIFMNYQKLFL